MIPPTPARLLIVDDEAHIRNGLGWSLRLNGYDVEEAASGSEALARLYHGAYDLMILDMNMPDLDGMEVMRRAHEHSPTLAIVVLTGHATLESAIAAVKANAADYLLKPVSMHDLAAVVAHALAVRAEQRQQQHVMDLVSQVVDALRKPEGAETAELAQPGTARGAAPQEAENFVRAGLLTLDLGKRIVTVAGNTPDVTLRTAEVTEGEATILHELMRHAGQVRSARQLVYAAWGYSLMELEAANIVRSYIYRLRRKLEADPDHPQLLKTVRGGGYYLSVGDEGAPKRK